MDIDEFLESEGSPEEKGGRKELVEKQSAEFITDLSLEGQVAKIRELMQAKRYKDAEKVYFTVKEQYATLAKRQEEARRKIHRELTAINKELLEHLDKVKGEMEQRTMVINDLLSKAQQYMLQGNTEKANQLYLQVREIFKQIPDAFAERKMLIENQILTFYSQLVNEFNKKNYGVLLQKRDEIMRHVEIATNFVNLGKGPEARKTYATINKLYNELPEGFMYEKAIIYKRVLALHQFIEEGSMRIGTAQGSMDAEFGMSMDALPPRERTLATTANAQIGIEPKEEIEKGIEAPPTPIAAEPVKKKGLFGFFKHEKGIQAAPEPAHLVHVSVQPRQKKSMDTPPLPM